MSARQGSITLWFDRWLFDLPNPRMVSVFRIGFAILLIVNAAVWLLHSPQNFSDDGVLSAETTTYLYGYQFPSIYFWIPSTPTNIRIGLICLLVHSVLLLVGIGSRIQAALIFFWLVSFQHRNPFMVDGEDVLFRLFSFFMIFLPLDCGWSVGRSLSARLAFSSNGVSSASAWAFRLIQVQMAAVYWSSTVCKLQGETWRDGTALFYVSHMHDYFGRLTLPGVVYTTPWLVALLTWSVLLVEFILPLLLWSSKFRRWGLALGFLLHLGIESSMHLFLFQWLMMLGLVTFVAERRESFGESPS